MLQIRSDASSTSSTVENRLKPKRMALWMTQDGQPIAVKTWLGGLLPLLHADPLLHAMPVKSRAISID